MVVTYSWKQLSPHRSIDKHAAPAPDNRIIRYMEKSKDALDNLRAWAGREIQVVSATLNI